LTWRMPAAATRPHSIEYLTWRVCVCEQKSRPCGASRRACCWASPPFATRAC
jgi:hypothetical protein